MTYVSHPSKSIFLISTWFLVYFCPKLLWEISSIFSWHMFLTGASQSGWFLLHFRLVLVPRRNKFLWHMFLTRASQSGRQMKVSEEVWVRNQPPSNCKSQILTPWYLDIKKQSKRISFQCKMKSHLLFIQCKIKYH